MKKAIFSLIIAALVIITSVFWIISSKTEFNLMEILPLGIIIIVVGFAAFIGYKRLTGARRGEPAEDELSKKILRKTSSLSYYISLYLWLVIMYFSDKTSMETHTLIAAGILGMALTFALCWLFIYFKGIKNE